MVRLFYPLVIFQTLQISSGIQSSQDALSLEFDLPKKSTMNHLSLNSGKRNLRNGSLNQCTVKFCQKCESDSDICEICETDYNLQDNHCNSAKKSSTDEINGAGLVGIIVGVSLFSLIFCIVCIYLSRKNRPKYTGSPNIIGDHTKSENTINEGQTPDDPGTPISNLSSPQSRSNQSIDEMNIRLVLLKHIFRNFPVVSKMNSLEENCSICLLTMKLKKLKQFRCGHLTHYKCCKDWITTGNSRCSQCSENLF